MRAIRSAHTKPEITVRRVAHGLGFRFRLHRRDLPGNPDLVFPSRKRIVFVHGCFWHQHPSPRCADARMPRSRQDYWIPKFQRTRERDKTNAAILRAAGWKILIVWECETNDEVVLRRRLKAFLSRP